MKKIDWMNILTRAAWTFAEGFFVTLFATVNVGMDEAALKAGLIGAAMAGVSAVKTFIVDLIQAQAAVG